MSKIRIVVTGSRGQVARSLVDLAPGADIEVVTLARPVLDLSDLRTIGAALDANAGDVLISAAAYSDVNRAESEPELADLINAKSPARLAARASLMGMPIIHLSTDYVFDGRKSAPYIESDPVRPLNEYGRSKAKGEEAIAAAHPQHLILRTAGIFSPFDRNFVRTMLQLATRQREIRVVSDQIANPTPARDIAAGILTLARNVVEGQGEDRYGTFHMASSRATSWADFAAEIFSTAAARGGPSAQVIPIASTDYQSPAERPRDARLDCTKIARVHGIALPDWKTSLGQCIDRILEQGA